MLSRSFIAIKGGVSAPTSCRCLTGLHGVTRFPHSRKQLGQTRLSHSRDTQPKLYPRLPSKPNLIKILQLPVGEIFTKLTTRISNYRERQFLLPFFLRQSVYRGFEVIIFETVPRISAASKQLTEPCLIAADDF